MNLKILLLNTAIFLIYNIMAKKLLQFFTENGTIEKRKRKNGGVCYDIQGSSFTKATC